MTALSKIDYLKKYMSKNEGEDDNKKAKKKKKKTDKNKSNVKVIDDDADFRELPGVMGQDLDKDDESPEYNAADAARLGRGEELPTVSGVVDERPADVIVKEKLASGQWKTMKEIKPKKNRKRRDSDTSPPRNQRRRRRDSDTSPPRNQRQRQNSDASPPRNHRQKRDDSDTSPPRNRHASPPRKKRKQRKRADSDASPPRNQGGKKSEEDVTIKEEPVDYDFPPESRNRESKRASDAEVKTEIKSEDSDASPPRRPGGPEMKKTLDGKKAGLQSAKALKGELQELRNKEKKMFQELKPEISGKGAETKVRGRLKAKEEEAKKKKEKNEITDAVKEKYAAWGRGVKQAEVVKARIQEDLKEMDKPLTRGADDVDLEDHLKGVEREEDPMLEYMRKKKRKVDDSAGVQRYPEYKGPQPPPNRFKIKPGYRWDGVDRSTGFETRLFQSLNKKKAMTEDAYKWSTEDM